jgi:hypothetical protein
MQAVEVEHYIRRATDFLEGMQLTRADSDYWNSSALLAIHSAVSFTDALRIGLGDTNLSLDNHRRAADLLDKLLSLRNSVDQRGLKHLRFLLSRKNLVAYEKRRLERTDYEALFTQAERFAHWADVTGSQLKIEGWKHGDQ